MEMAQKQISEDRGLIRYLLRHRHTTPFEMCEIKLLVRIPMDAWRQWIRHRTANVNEYSTRYSIAIDAMQTTLPEEWRIQSKDSKQGSAGFLDASFGRELTKAEKELQSKAREVYEERLRHGIAREQARKDLPLSTYTEAYWKIDLHNLLHFLSLRMDAHAQQEIRAYADVIGYEIAKRWCPTVWEAFVDYRLQATTLTRIDKEIIALIAQKKDDDADHLLQKLGLLKYNEKGKLLRSRERTELETKLKDLGLKAPWLKKKILA